MGGMVILVAGEPGIGKSTLLTQVALQFSEKSAQGVVLYVCGEEALRSGTARQTHRVAPCALCGSPKEQPFRCLVGIYGCG